LGLTPDCHNDPNPAIPFFRRTGKPYVRRGRKQRGKEMEMNAEQLFRKFLADESGQDLIEYALVAALIGLGSVAALSNLSNTLANALGGVGNALNNSTA
jgi:pilus assembly protein Flp/PilA